MANTVNPTIGIKKQQSTRRSKSEVSPAYRLSKDDRRQQLLDTALIIIREEGADQLTLGYLAERAGVSKPIAYEHFGTRSGLLIALYRTLDSKQIETLHATLAAGDLSGLETSQVLAAAYIRCASDASGDWQAVGAALTGSSEKEAVVQELLEGYVQLFAAVLAPHSTLAAADLERCCIGLVGAGEALANAVVQHHHSEAAATAAFATLIQGSLIIPRTT